MKNSDAFHIWLIDVKKYGDRSARDVISRLSRIDKWLDLPEIITPFTIFSLEQTPQFLHLTLTVKSQLKKALKLLIEYQESK